MIKPTIVLMMISTMCSQPPNTSMGSNRLPIHQPRSKKRISMMITATTNNADISESLNAIMHLPVQKTSHPSD
jgi:hypothetical protein